MQNPMPAHTVYSIRTPGMNVHATRSAAPMMPPACITRAPRSRSPHRPTAGASTADINSASENAPVTTHVGTASSRSSGRTSIAKA
jgi:hypothetical protein